MGQGVAKSVATFHLQRGFLSPRTARTARSTVLGLFGLEVKSDHGLRGCSAGERKMAFSELESDPRYELPK